MVTITQLAEQKIKELMTEEKMSLAVDLCPWQRLSRDISTGWLSSRKWPTTIRLLRKVT